MKRDLLLEGGGNFLKDYFKEYFEKYNLKFNKGMEMCAGKGYIGFYLLERGYFETMDFVDINPDACEYLENTIKKRNLQNKCRVYQSDCFDNKNIETNYDNIVVNPPNCPNEWYFYESEETTISVPPLIYVDKDWQFHKKFIKESPNYAKSLVMAECIVSSHTSTFEPMLTDTQKIKDVKMFLFSPAQEHNFLPLSSYLFTLENDIR